MTREENIRESIDYLRSLPLAAHSNDSGVEILTIEQTPGNPIVVTVTQGQAWASVKLSDGTVVEANLTMPHAVRGLIRCFL